MYKDFGGAPGTKQHNPKFSVIIIIIIVVVVVVVVVKITNIIIYIIIIIITIIIRLPHLSRETIDFVFYTLLDRFVVVVFIY